MKKNGMTSETTQSQAFDDKMCKMMLGLLDSGYPVTKIKENKRFKRGVNIDGNNYLLPKDELGLFGELYKILKLFYASTDDEIVYVIRKYYNLKT